MSRRDVRRRPLVMFLVGTALLAAATAALAQTAPPAAGSLGPGPPPLEEVVVTAQKRSQRLQDVPISETVIGAEELQSLQIQNGTDLAKQTPNLRVSNLGNEDQPKFSMRGIATPDFNLNTISPIGIFYDEVFVGAQWMGGPQTFDMSRIEILRGPQGTLFGKNTTGGAVNFITTAPSLVDTGGYVTAEYGNNQYYHVTGAGQTPLVDGVLGVRLAFNVTRSDGWVENLYQGLGARDLSSTDNRALRLSFAFKHEDFDATLRVVYTRSTPTNIGIIAYGLNPDGTQADGVNPRLNPYTGQSMSLHQGAYDDSAGIHEGGAGGYLTLNWGITPEFSVTSISSWFNGSFFNSVDADGSYVPDFRIDFYADEPEVSQDLRLTSHFPGPANFIFGLYYTHDEIDIRTNYFLGLAPTVPTGPVVGLYRQAYRQDRTSYASYFDGTYDFAPGWQFYGGLRVTQDRGAVHNYRVTSDIGAGGVDVPDLSYNNSAPTGRIGINHHFSPDIMVYGQYSRGYRSSAFNGGALTSNADLNIAKPEYLDALELGYKSELLGHRLQLNADAFYYKYKHQQFLVPGANFTSQEVNADARNYGAELELLARPIDPLSLSVGLGLLDAKYTSGELANPITNAPTELSGNRTIEAPVSTLNLAGDYTIPIAGMRSIVLHADAVHVASEYYTAVNVSQAHTPAFWEGNARIAFRDDPHHLELALWIKNFNNNITPTGFVLNPTTAEIFTTIPYPRRYGAGFTYRF
jgi:iron complex outermembrane recepter protein